MARDFATVEDSNRSSNPSLHDVSDPARRTVLGAGLGVAVGGLLHPADPNSGEVRRFPVGPPGCEITRATATPDGGVIGT
ncbi:MAG: hypothetical protein HXY24_07180 [Rubrivivax sp.]|nr:hypothetical protein [Rubrivivax sp.]